jgi:serine/threonine protein phosphatase PrpC
MDVPEAPPVAPEREVEEERVAEPAPILEGSEPKAQAEAAAPAVPEPAPELAAEAGLAAETDLESMPEAPEPEEVGAEPKETGSPEPFEAHEPEGQDEMEAEPLEPLPVESLGSLPPEEEGIETAGEEANEEVEAFPEAGEEIPSFWREGPSALAAELPGELFAGRFVVLRVLEEQADTVLYQAHDLQRCWQCGFEGNAPDDDYCARCGAVQDRRPQVQVREVRDPADWEPLTDSALARVDHEGRTFLVMAEPGGLPDEPLAPSLRLRVGQRSDVGQVRELNEDGMLVFTLAPTYQSQMDPLVGLFAVADGMGGHEGGEIASKLALQVFADQVLRGLILPLLGEEPQTDEGIVARLRQAIVAANDQVYLARHKRQNDMGTTLTAALVRNDRLFLAHVGDCRAYRWNADGLTQLTRDHSVVASMIAEGRAAPDEIYTHPHRSVIYRCVGDQPTVEVDGDHLPLAVGDRLVLCSDGLWEMVRSEGVADAMMQEADPQAACDLLVRRANVAGGEDNISVIVVQVEEG